MTLSALEPVAEDEAAATLCQQVAQEVRAGAPRLIAKTSGAESAEQGLACLSGVAQGAPARADGHRTVATGAASGPRVGPLGTK